LEEGMPMGIALKRIHPAAPLIMTLLMAALGGHCIAAVEYELDLAIALKDSAGSMMVPAPEEQYVLTAEWKDEQGRVGTIFDRSGFIQDGRITLRDFKPKKVYDLKAYKRSHDPGTGEITHQPLYFRAGEFDTGGLPYTFEIQLTDEMGSSTQAGYVEVIKFQFLSYEEFILDPR
jgi:hypothetical protein